MILSVVEVEFIDSHTRRNLSAKMDTSKPLTFDEFVEICQRTRDEGTMLSTPEIREAYESGVSNLMLHLRRVMFEGLTYEGVTAVQA